PRIVLAKPREENAYAPFGEFRLEARAQRFVARRKAEVVDDARDVQPRAAHEDRIRAPRMDSADGLARGLLVPGDGSVLGGVENVDHVVRDAAPFAERKLRCTDVHASVQLHGVCADDLGAAALAHDELREIERELALTRSRGADDREK